MDAAGLEGLRTISQFVARAREVTQPGLFDWAAGAAGEEVTLSRNLLALNRLALVPRLLRGAETVDTRTSLLGIPLALPVFLAPVGALALYHESDAEGSADGAARAGTIAFCATQLANARWEAVAATAPGRNVFQLYVLGDRAWLGDVLERVAAAGFAAVCVTADTPIPGLRDRSEAGGFVWTNERGGTPVNLVQHGWDTRYRRSFDWDDLAFVCERSPLPVLLKGVLTGADAERALSVGVQAVYVSNHGGRTLDHGLSTIEVLREVVDAVAGRAEVLVDSGFTRGTEVCAALALGARAVGLGRLQCWGLAVGAAAGVARILEILRAEEVTLASIGCATVDELTPEHVRWTDPAPPLWPR